MTLYYDKHRTFFSRVRTALVPLQSVEYLQVVVTLLAFTGSFYKRLSVRVCVFKKKCIIEKVFRFEAKQRGFHIEPDAGYFLFQSAHWESKNWINFEGPQIGKGIG